ncbi:MAG: type IV secretion system protein [Terriglobales bacterium]
MVLALATIMMVWFGVQEALASASGGPGFDMRRFISFFILITFAYSFVNFYNTAIPGIGTSLKGFIDGGTANLVEIIGQDSFNTMTAQIDGAAKNMGTAMPSVLLSPYKSFVFFMVQMALAVANALILAIVAYGIVASTIIGLLGPIFIPFLVFEKLDWLFWGWLKAYLGFSFYKVIAAATLNVLAHLLTQYFSGLGQDLSDPQLMIAAFPFLIVLMGITSFILIKIPAMVHTLFSGGTGGHDGGFGAAIMAIRAAM